MEIGCLMRVPNIDITVNPRKSYIDVARGICMICIVLGHLGNPFINRFVFTFHLPVFFIITGYFFNPEVSFKNLAVKRFRGLIIPYFFACACILVSYFSINTFILHSNLTDVILSMKRIVISVFWGAGDSWEKPFQIPGIGAIWFLWATFWACLIFYYLLKIPPVKRALIICGLFIFARWSVNHIGFAPLSIQPALSALLFIYVGYLWRCYEPEIRKTPVSVKALTAVLASLLWIQFICEFKSFWLVHSDYGRGFTDVISSFAASFLVLAISYAADEKCGRLLTPVKLLGRYSVIALCAHIIELNTFPWSNIVEILTGGNSQYLIALCLKFFLKLCWIFLFTYIMSRFEVTKKIFGIKTRKNEKK